MSAATRPDAFSEDDVTLLGQTSAQIAIALENARAYEEVTDRNAQLIDEKQYLERELHQRVRRDHRHERRPAEEC